MFTTKGSVKTDKAAKYLVQLCKHFAHKADAEWDSEQAKVQFEPGLCTMTATDSMLVFNCTADAPEKLQQMIFILEVHLVRFAWRENVDLNWTDEDSQPVMKASKVIDMLATEREKFAAKRKD